MTVSQAKKTRFARNVIAVFVRAPLLGAVKTRLAQSVGERAALEIYVAMLRDVFAYAQEAASQIDDAEVVVFYTPSDAFLEGENSLSELWRGAHHSQCGGDLGARLLDCFQHLRENGAQNIVVIGSDAPDLPPHFLLEAYRVLDARDLVFGASEDGGFYLMGASCDVARAVFSNVRWSSEFTLRDVLQNSKNKSVGFLSPWSDVDTLSDLRDMQRRLQSGDSVAPQTLRVLQMLNF